MESKGANTAITLALLLIPVSKFIATSRQSDNEMLSNNRVHFVNDTQRLLSNRIQKKHADVLDYTCRAPEKWYASAQYEQRAEILLPNGGCIKKS